MSGTRRGARRSRQARTAVGTSGNPSTLQPRRWPLHPQPGPLESLSSWLTRLAEVYDLPREVLLTHNLGLVDLVVPVALDHDPPAEMLAALAERTGVEVARLRAMTLLGWEPWLFDRLWVARSDAQAVFDTYVRANSVLLAPGEAGTNQLFWQKRWSGPWLPEHWLNRVCPVCAADPDRGRALMWRLPLMVGCADHGCRLEENVSAVEVAVLLAADGKAPPVKPTPVGEPLATLDRYTHQALTAGRVDLPGRTVHAGVWFRLLRSVLDEVSLAPTVLRAHSRATLAQVWQATGRPERAGLRVWQPYEHLDWGTQEALLHAAATALQLVADGHITARGVFGSALRAAVHQRVYDGDPPAPHRPPTYRSAWQEAIAEAEAAIMLARTDRDTARQLLALLTLGCRTLDRFEEERSYLFGIGVPAEFLPTARELGRGDLV